MVRDLYNRVRFGDLAPLSDAAIFVDAETVVDRYDHDRAGRRFRRQDSGAVIGGDWDQFRSDVEADTKLVSCRMRYEGGAEWADTPVYQRMLAEIARGHDPDGCATETALQARYAELDRIFEETRKRGRLLRASETPQAYRREHGGIFLHVARDGTCLRGGGGAHRFAIAKILRLTAMPAQIGVVHPQAVVDGQVARLMAAAA
ncbi:hypothetical protein [Thalassococcus arenae]|uniref:hypothetical protein n=1 Tax=Thalassococcus arenae TaxID=2851652 RepID=UPI0032B00FE6